VCDGAIVKVVKERKFEKKLEVKKEVASPQLGGKARLIRIRWGRRNSKRASNMCESSQQVESKRKEGGSSSEQRGPPDPPVGTQYLPSAMVLH
jgi:hypothetical protein